jgi:hypothetical protein
MPSTTSVRGEKATGRALRFQFTKERFANVQDEDMVVPDFILPEPPQKRPDNKQMENVSGGSTEQEQDPQIGIGPVVRLIGKDVAPRRFEILQQWEGVVSKVEGVALWAELLDMTKCSNPAEEVELPLAEIPIADRELLGPGSVFYWSIGYETSPGGQIRRVSEIRLRRAPLWSQGMIDAAKAKAKELWNRFGSDFNNQNSKQLNDAGNTVKITGNSGHVAISEGSGSVQIEGTGNKVKVDQGKKQSFWKLLWETIKGSWTWFRKSA